MTARGGVLSAADRCTRDTSALRRRPTSVPLRMLAPPPPVLAKAAIWERLSVAGRFLPDEDLVAAKAALRRVADEPAPRGAATQGAASAVPQGTHVVVRALKTGDAQTWHYDNRALELWRDGNHSALVLDEDDLCVLDMKPAPDARRRRVAVRTLDECSTTGGRLALVVQLEVYAKKLSRDEDAPVTIDERRQAPLLRGWDRVVLERRQGA